jgi:hypothetical protein
MGDCVNRYKNLMIAGSENFSVILMFCVVLI